MNIWVVGKDPGGTAGVIPIVQILRSKGHQVEFFANKAIVKLTKLKFYIINTQTILSRCAKKTLLLYSKLDLVKWSVITNMSLLPLLFPEERFPLLEL